MRETSDAHPLDERSARAALDTLRSETRDRIGALTGLVRSITDASELTTHDDEHDPEGATIGFERSQAQSLLAAARDELAAVDQAEQRLAAGTYGSCERCGGPIAGPRLLALPATTTCIRCAQARDARRRESR